jgi:hypothetical protein
MAKRDAAWWREYRARKAAGAASPTDKADEADPLRPDLSLAEYMLLRLDKQGVDAILDGIHATSPEPWRKYVAGHQSKAKR